MTENGIRCIPFDSPSPPNGPDGSGSLLLAYSAMACPGLFYLAAPALLTTGCLSDKLIISPSAIKQAFSDHHSFAVLRALLEKYQSAAVNDELQILLTYFFLNPFPFSVPLISRWIEDLGTEKERAGKLAKAVFEARTCREDPEPWFMDSQIPPSREQHAEKSEEATGTPPEDLSSAIDRYHRYTNIGFRYDFLDSESETLSGYDYMLNLTRVNECGFQVVDHGSVLIGLAATVTELAKLTETRWPVFLNRLLGEVPVNLRDFYSTGRLMAEKPDVLRMLMGDYSHQIEVISTFDGKRLIKTSFESALSVFLKNGNPAGIPLFLRIGLY